MSDTMMNTVIHSQLLEDQCMKKLNWSIQRVANATMHEMEEALQISETLQSSSPSSSSTTPPSSSTTKDPQGTRKFNIASRQHSQRTSPTRSISCINTEISHTELPHNTDTDDHRIYASTIEKHAQRLQYLLRRIEKKEHILHTQQTTEKDSEFLQAEIKKEQDLLHQVQNECKSIQKQITHHIKSKQVLIGYVYI